MDAIKAEIARKRKQLEEAKVVSEGKKYFKRSDLISKEENEYLEKNALQMSKDALNATRLASRPGTSSDATGGLPDSCSNVEDMPRLTRREVIRRLRERGEPITLFGENELEAFKRLRKLEILEPEVNRGLRNDLQAALEQVDQAYLEEILKTTKTDSSGPQEKKKLGDVNVQEDNYTFEEIREMAVVAFRNRKDLEGHAQMILKWLKFLLKTWGQHLNNREEHEKLSTKGKLASATYTQTVEYLRPLMRKLKTNTLTDDILESLTEIVHLMLDKEYIRANDAYLEMAIGNAPWPIGVTMVGIHARTGREKIFSRNVAHVMNDETQRKYIQGLKRLMTKCQIMFPTMPSKSVEFTPDSTIC